MSTERLIWAVVALTLGVVACITALTIWGTGDIDAAAAKILGVAAPAISVLILILQVSRKAEEVKREARFVAEVTAEGLEGARDSARRAKATQEQTTKAVERVMERVNEIKDMADTVNEIKTAVNGEKHKLISQNEHLLHKVAELENRLKRELLP